MCAGPLGRGSTGAECSSGATAGPLQEPVSSSICAGQGKSLQTAGTNQLLPVWSLHAHTRHVTHAPKQHAWQCVLQCCDRRCCCCGIHAACHPANSWPQLQHWVHVMQPAQQARPVSRAAALLQSQCWCAAVGRHRCGACRLQCCHHSKARQRPGSLQQGRTVGQAGQAAGSCG